MDNETKSQESQEVKQLDSTQEPVKPMQEPEKDKGGRPENCGHCSKPKRPDSKEYSEQDEYCHCGRPTKFTLEIISKLKDAFAIDANITQACKYAEITTETFYQWLKENPKFSGEITAMREALPLKAKENIARRIHVGDTALSKWLIERKESKEAIDTIRHEHTGSISNEPYTAEDDEDPEVKEARENLHNKRRASWQRRAIEKDTRLKELQAQRAKKNGQNSNNASGDQLVDNNSVSSSDNSNGEPAVVAGNSADNLI